MSKMIFGVCLSILLANVQAGEMDPNKMDHAQMNHGEMKHDDMMLNKKPDSRELAKLSKIPASGKAREGGADGRYVMESISVSDSLASQCAKASRGLMMLDNASWEKCGGKPEGAAVTPASMVGQKDASEHAGHHMP